MKINFGCVQNLKPTCDICKYHHYSTFEKSDGWCSHIKINGRKIPDNVAKLGIQLDCPFKN